MHVVEIILIVLLLFFVFTQFSSIPTNQIEWSRIKLGILGDDVLKVLNLKGVDWFNRTSIERELEKLLPSNIMYSVVLKNVIKPKIKTGCLCDEDEKNAIENALKPGFDINGQDVTFEVIGVNSIDELFSFDFDVVLIPKYTDLTQHLAQIRNFLSKGKGVVEVFDLPKIDYVQREVFGLDTGEEKATEKYIVFTDESKDASNEINKIYRYFYNIPRFYDTFNSTYEWANLTGLLMLAPDGNPSPSLFLGNDTRVYTRFYKGFDTGEIDMDIMLDKNALLLVGFRFDSNNNQYFASFSSNSSFGFDSFYRSDSSLHSIGTNTSHITEPGAWHRIRIAAEGNLFRLYSDGKLVASATGEGSIIKSNITLLQIHGNSKVDNIKVTFHYGHRMSNFLTSNENTTQANNETYKILLRQIGSGVPACIINYNVEGKGRTAWLSAGDLSVEEQKIILKSILAWAAGDEYKVITSDIKKPVSSFIYTVSNKDMLQPVKVILELGYLY